jgi:hypothetical protein
LSVPGTTSRCREWNISNRYFAIPCTVNFWQHFCWKGKINELRQNVFNYGVLLRLHDIFHYVMSTNKMHTFQINVLIQLLVSYTCFKQLMFITSKTICTLCSTKIQQIKIF